MYETFKYKICLLQPNLDEEMNRNKLCVVQIGSYRIHRKVKNKDVILISVIVINSITGWFDITQYEDKHSVTITNLV